MSVSESNTPSFWFVGASYGGVEDQTERFLEEGIWHNGHQDEYLDLVSAMKPGDKIAIKASYTQRHDLPFDNRGHFVSVMAIKAIGEISESSLDGATVKVNWQLPNQVRKWFFYTFRKTVIRISADSWQNEALLDFAFSGKEQDYAKFQNAPYWRDKFGDHNSEYLWTNFYEEIAKGLLQYRNDRKILVKGIHEIGSKVGLLTYLEDQFADGTKGPLQDICPFTAMGIFNRLIKDENRQKIAGELANLLDVDVPVPSTFEGVPVLNNRKSWFFGFAKDRDDGDIEALWNVFECAANFVSSDKPEYTEEFSKAYDSAIAVAGVRWNLSTGLYWAHPWDFPTLDKNSRSYIENHLAQPVIISKNNDACSASTYLQLTETLSKRFDEDSYPVHSFPELSLEARKFGGGNSSHQDTKDIFDSDTTQIPSAPEPYSASSIVKDGCFLDRNEIELLIERLKSKKNIILQGPPGTGKTWLARRLAFALMGEKNPKKVRTVQFHPNLSYEDFVRGWRPAADGKLIISDGVFMEAIHAALDDADAKIVLVIEEINRGNPAQVFGELLTLLEASKRTPNDAIELCYPDANGSRHPVHIPENLYVIGTMNIADRSLALVDIAFRRRFAFATLEPKIGDSWKNWVVQNRGIDSQSADDIENRMKKLNEVICKKLGYQFMIGHSYVTPSKKLDPESVHDWLVQVAETEIGPLLAEYWFDSPKTAEELLKEFKSG